MLLSHIARSALTAALVAAAGAAGSYAIRHYFGRPAARPHREGRQEKVDVSRWEGEGGSPPDVTASVPHQPVAVR